MTSALEQLNQLPGSGRISTQSSTFEQEEEALQQSFVGMQIAGMEEGDLEELEKPESSKEGKIKRALLGLGPTIGPAAYTTFSILGRIMPGGIAFKALISDEGPVDYLTGEVAAITPAISYLDEDKRAKFLEETRKDPVLGTRMILEDLAWTELDLFFFSAGGSYAITKGLKGAKLLTIAPVKAARRLLRGRKVAFKPVADLVTWKHQNYNEAAHQLLKRKSLIKGEPKGYIWDPSERNAILDAMQGDTSGLKDMMLRPDLPSKGFRNAVETTLKPTLGGKNLIEYELTSQLKNYLDPATLRKNYFIDEFSKRLKSAKILNLKMGELTPRHIEVALKDVLKKHDFDGALGLRDLKLEDASVRMLDNAVQFIDNDYRAKAIIWKHMSPPALASLRPVRVVMEALDPMYRTMEKVYKPISQSVKEYSRYQVAKIEDFKAMLCERGLMRIKKTNVDGINIYERTALFTPKIEKKAVEVLRGSKEIMDEASKVPGRESIREAMNEIESLRTMGLNAEEQKVLRSVLGATYRLNDKLYREYAAWQIPKIVSGIKGTVTRQGMREMDRLIYEGQVMIGEAFNMANDFSYLNKRYSVADGLAHIRKGIVEGLKDSKNPWVIPEGFHSNGKPITRSSIADWLHKKLTLGKEKINFRDYLSMDFPGPQQVDDMTKALYAKISPTTKRAYETIRNTSTLERTTEGLDEMIASKIRYQARQITLHDTIEKVVVEAKAYPNMINDYIGHYIGRVLGVPSTWDIGLGKFLDATAGRIERGLLHKEGVWDANRAMNLSRNINDFTYMGFLGLKPFSAMRNLFQPLLMVPADLGGSMGLPHLVQGYGKLITEGKPRFAALREMGILSEYGPELYSSSKFLNFGKKNIRGLELPFEMPTRSDIRRFTMWMFRSSDEMNRYVTGSAAWERWDWALRQVAPLKGLRTGPIPEKSFNEFFRKVGTSGRRENVRHTIEDLVRKGRMQEAKASFIRDVVGDTQYLYGGVDAPLATHMYGAAGRTAAVFQSWWINYGHAVQKWLVTGDAPSEKIARMLNFTMSSAMVYTVARAMWGHDSASRMVLAGPFPQPSAGIPMPPAMQPFSELMGVIAEAAKIPVDGSSRAPAMLKATLDTSINFAPGGLQIKQTFKATKKAPSQERVEALIKSLGKFKGWGG